MRIFSYIIIGLALVTSCKMGKNYQGAELTIPDKYMYAQSDSSTNDFLVNVDTLTADSTLDYDWFTLFQDPVLDTLIDKALHYNFDLNIAAQNILQAQYALSRQKADMLPQFGYQAGVVRGNYQGAMLPDVQNQFYGLGTVSWEIDFWGKYRRLNEAARAEYLVSSAGYRATQVSLMANVADLYFQMLEYQTRLEISQQNLSLRDSMLAIIQHRFDKGYIPEIDLNQAQIQRAIAAGTIPIWQRRLAMTQNQLSTITGTHPRTIQTGIDLVSQDTSFAIPAGLPSDLLSRRPDIMAAEQVLIAENARIGATQANRLPNISLTGVLGVSSDELSGLSTDNLAWNVGAGLLGPLFYWNKNKRLVDIQRSRTEQALLAYQRTAYDAFREVDDVLITISTLKVELVARRDHRTAALRAQTLSQERYSQGVTSYLEYLESQRQAFDAEQNYAGTWKDLLSAYAQLYKALGGGWNIK